MPRRVPSCIVAGVVALTALCGKAQSGPIDVSVGYADGLRASGFFPNPWQGSANTVFTGFSEGGSYDAGAIMITNNTGAAVTVNDVSVAIHPVSYPGTVFDLWGSQVLLPGQSWVITQTHDFNFDTSDYPISPNGVAVSGGPDSPKVTVTINGVATDLFDTAHVLDTSGYDFAYNGSNESFQWRPIGTFGGPSGVPEPASVTLLGLGVLAIGGYKWRKRRQSS